MKYLILLAVIFSIGCSKDENNFKVNKFEVSFVSYDADKISKYVLYASGNGKDFLPIKEITPSAGKDMEYKVQFTIPQEKLDADGKVLFYMEETSTAGNTSKTEIITVQ